MCWNPEVSLSTYLFSIIPVAVLTFYYGKMPFYTFLAFNSFISMQLVEFFLWTFLSDPQKNAFFSILGFITIMSQPLFFMLSIENGIPKNIIPLIAIIAYIICVIVYFSYNYNKIEFRTVVAKNGHLEWKWLDVPLYNALLWVAFFLFRPSYFLLKNPAKYSSEIIPFTIILGSFIVSYISFREAKTWGTMWCWIANAVSIRYWLQLFSILS